MQHQYHPPPLPGSCNTSTIPHPFLGADECVTLLDSHYDTNGDKPYHRLFRAGCREHVMENIWGQDGEVRRRLARSSPIQ